MAGPENSPRVFDGLQVMNFTAEDLADTILRLQAEQNRRARERDIEDLKHRAEKATRSKTWPLTESDAVDRSHRKVEASTNNAEIPL